MILCRTRVRLEMSYFSAKRRINNILFLVVLLFNSFFKDHVFYCMWAAPIVSFSLLS